MNADYKYLNELLSLTNELDSVLRVEAHHPSTYPLDSDVREKLTAIISHLSEESSEYKLYQDQDVVHTLWVNLLSNAIQCLRYFDKREPFLSNPSKHPLAYGVTDLDAYYKKYREFEKVMYGGVSHYRDHIVHVFRVWLLGCVILCRNKCEYLYKISIDEACVVNNYEKLSVWTIISLTHDLGYPLEKASQIIDKTKEMMTAFITNPTLSMDLSFNGVQNSMNDFILRLMSSKMIEKDEFQDREDKYVARLQSKYYFKFQKSLEHSKHGILSAIIIYKLLLYFLESDYTINEDYRFMKEDVRQFYIRRDILRSIASHTCQDIYQLNIFSFSFLLITCDDAQEWGRKSISHLYAENLITYRLGGISFKAVPSGGKDVYSCVVDDKYNLSSSLDCQIVFNALNRLSKGYKIIYRDGQDSNNRNFNFIKNTSIYIQNESKALYHISLEVSKTAPTIISIYKKFSKKLKEDDVIKSFKSVFPDGVINGRKYIYTVK